jgi:hypothetical protein
MILSLELRRIWVWLRNRARNSFNYITVQIVQHGNLQSRGSQPFPDLGPHSLLVVDSRAAGLHLTVICWNAIAIYWKNAAYQIMPTIANRFTHRSILLKMAVFWVVAPCSLVEVYRPFRGAYCLHHQGDEAARTAVILVNFYQTTRRYNPEDSHLRTHRRENLKSYLI